MLIHCLPRDIIYIQQQCKKKVKKEEEKKHIVCFVRSYYPRKKDGSTYFSSTFDVNETTDYIFEKIPLVFSIVFNLLK